MVDDESLNQYRDAVRARPELNPIDGAAKRGEEDDLAKPGQQPFGSKYEVRSQLAETRLSRTWRAWDRERRTLVVIKEPRAHLLLEGRSGERFRREVELASRLMHPNIVPILATQLAEPPWFYTMPLIEGQDLSSYCRQRRLSIGQRLRLFRHVCEAIAHAHQHGVIHRDLKPGNILMEENGEPQILDFGLGELLGTEPDELDRGRVLGSPGYMSPEQAQGYAMDTRTDVYALGAVLYELLTSRLPVEPGPDLRETLRRVCDESPIPPESLVGDCSAELSAIVMKALAQNPNQRYAGVRELIDDLDNYANQRPLAAVPASTSYVVRKWLRRNSRGVVLAAVGLAIVAAVTVSLAVNWHLRTSREIERHTRAVLMGRMQTLRDDPHNASLLLWREFLTHDSVRTRYALFEMYLRYPCLRSKATVPLFDVLSTADGKRVVCTTRSGGLLVCDATTLETLQSVPAEQIHAACIAFAGPEGPLLVGGNDGVLRALPWSPDSGLFAPDEARVLATADSWHTLAVSPNGEWWAASAEHGSDPEDSAVYDAELFVWQIVAGEPILRRRFPMARERITSLVFSGDGDQLAVASWQRTLPDALSSAVVCLWNTGTWEVSCESVFERNTISAMLFSQDGSMLYCAGGEVSALNLDTLECTIEFDDPRWGIRTMVTSTGLAQRCIACASGDGRVRFLDAAQHAPIAEEGFHAVVADQVGAAFLPGGHAAVSASADGLKLWRFPAQSWLELAQFWGTDSLRPCISDDGTCICVAEEMPLHPCRLGIWVRNESEDSFGHWTWDAKLGGLNLSPDGEYAALCRIKDNAHKLTVACVDSIAQEIAAIDWDETRIDISCWLPGTESTLLVGAGDGRVKLWNFEQRPHVEWSELETLCQLPSGCPSITVDATGRWVATVAEGPRSDGHVVVWRFDPPQEDEMVSLANFQRAGEFVTPAYTWRAVFIDAGGELLLATTGSFLDIYLWDVPTGRPLGRMAGHRDAIFHAHALTPSLLTTGSRDGTVRIWDVAEREEICLLYNGGAEAEKLGLAAANGRAVISDRGRVWVVDTRDIDRFIAGNRAFMQKCLKAE